MKKSILISDPSDSKPKATGLPSHAVPLVVHQNPPKKPFQKWNSSETIKSIIQAQNNIISKLFELKYYIIRIYFHKLFYYGLETKRISDNNYIN